MKGALRPTIALLYLFLIAAMLSTSFMATQGFFNDFVTSKQYGLEIICLYIGCLFVLTHLFQKQLQFTKIDLLVLLFAIWYAINKLFRAVNGEKKRKLASSAANASSPGSLLKMKGGDETKLRI
jgi:hypothetical protein